MTEDLYKYRVRVSPKGKNVRLRVTVKDGLEVVIPRGYDIDKLPSILERKKNWIRAAQERAASHKKFFEPEPEWKLPVHINLPAIGKTWYVTKKESDVDWVAVRETGENQLLIFGAVNDKQACYSALGRWLIRQTRRHLVERLQKLSIKMGLNYNRVFVKRQKTRWASCSRHGTISLNAKLLFLPPNIVDYVMIHELCHLEEMNHSKRYWQLVSHHCRDYRRYDAKLREMWKVVPRWAR